MTWNFGIGTEVCVTCASTRLGGFSVAFDPSYFEWSVTSEFVVCVKCITLNFIKYIITSTWPFERLSWPLNVEKLHANFLSLIISEVNAASTCIVIELVGEHLQLIPIRQLNTRNADAFWKISRFEMCTR